MITGVPEPIEKPKTGPAGVEDIFDFEHKTPAPAPERRVEQAPEKTVEQRPEQRPDAREDEQAQRQYAPPPATATPPPAATPTKSPELEAIENILADNLEPLFLQMDPQQQLAFKQKGEETATKVDKLLQETRIKVKEIINVIRDWLKLLPGINKFFLEQEAKIKTDRLLSWREQRQNKQ